MIINFRTREISQNIHKLTQYSCCLKTKGRGLKSFLTFAYVSFFFIIILIIKVFSSQ
jgi:hypothetical protein